MPFDVQRIRSDFPILSGRVHGKPLVYLDNAATTHKPQQVIDAIVGFYTHDNANVHRGMHELARRATDGYEAARGKVARFVGAPDHRSVVFTSGTTDAVNLVAYAYAEPRLKAGDRIVLTHMEHHSNIVPWQLVAERTGAEIVAAPITDAGELDLEALHALLDERVKIVAAAWVSNTLGTVNDVRRLASLAHGVGAVLLLDGAQALAHVPIDVREVGCDFLALSAHKALGPTGIGALYAKPELLGEMPPFKGGGEMIEQVTFPHTTYAAPPARFEAGTPNIAGAIGFGAALNYLSSVDREGLAAHERELTAYGTRLLGEVEGLRILGNSPTKAPVFSFTLDWAHPYDVAPILDHMGVAVRTGHHCTQPLMDRFGLPATVRASCALYTTREEIDALITALGKAREMLA